MIDPSAKERLIALSQWLVAMRNLESAEAISSMLADLEAAERERDEARKQLGSILYLTKAPSTQTLVDGYLERDEARAEADRLREALELLAERWPDSEAGNMARAALEPRDG